jgi:hypothetical protein
MTTLNKITTKTLNKDFSNGSQDAVYKENFTLTASSEDMARDFKLRISIKRDSYDKQSYAQLSAFSEQTLSWNIIDSIHYSKMNLCTNNTSYVSVTENDFLQDRKTLLALAKDLFA